MERVFIKDRKQKRVKKVDIVVVVDTSSSLQSDSGMVEVSKSVGEDIARLIKGAELDAKITVWPTDNFLPDHFGRYKKKADVKHFSKDIVKRVSLDELKEEVSTMISVVGVGAADAKEAIYQVTADLFTKRRNVLQELGLLRRDAHLLVFTVTEDGYARETTRDSLTMRQARFAANAVNFVAKGMEGVCSINYFNKDNLQLSMIHKWFNNCVNGPTGLSTRDTTVRLRLEDDKKAGPKIMNSLNTGRLVPFFKIGMDSYRNTLVSKKIVPPQRREVSNLNLEMQPPLLSKEFLNRYTTKDAIKVYLDEDWLRSTFVYRDSFKLVLSYCLKHRIPNRIKTNEAGAESGRN